jgi:hypothetical protein
MKHLHRATLSQMWSTTAVSAVIKLQHSVWTPKPNTIKGLFYSVHILNCINKMPQDLLAWIQNIIMELHETCFFNFKFENVMGHILMLS